MSILLRYCDKSTIYSYYFIVKTRVFSFDIVVKQQYIILYYSKTWVFCCDIELKQQYILNIL